MKNQQVLYVSYDGMTDPLGQSQVLPYICGLADLGYRFTLLTSEKPDRMKAAGGLIREICKKHQIDWVPLTFHTQPKLLSKLYDVRNLKKRAVALHKQKKFELIHCRSYVGVDVGLHLKKKFGVKVLFDMRGFWVDERVDGNMWNLKNPVYKYAFRHYKNKENYYVSAADHIVSLTEAGKREIVKWKGYRNAEISVIPCSADFNVFTLLSDDEKKKARQELGLPQNGLVLSYLGSIGSWYLLPEMISLFAHTRKKYPGAKFLFITSGDPNIILAEATRQHIPHEDIVIRFASRKEVNIFTKAGDINICFIKQAYSKIASSPTKLGEIFAMGIPVVCNDGVGDVREIVESVDGGEIISNFNESEYSRVVAGFDNLLKKNPAAIRQQALPYYSLDRALETYASIYRKLI